jgi:hypothetical protein
MRGVVFPGDRLVSYVDVPDPTPGPLDVIVEMKASGMCGTDLQNYRRPHDLAPYMPSLIGRPPIAGHEPAGIVSAAVLPGQARVGERVMVHHDPPSDDDHRLMDFLDGRPSLLREIHRRARHRCRPNLYRSLVARSGRRSLSAVRPRRRRQGRVSDVERVLRKLLPCSGAGRDGRRTCAVARSRVASIFP